MVNSLQTIRLHSTHIDSKLLYNKDKKNYRASFFKYVKSTMAAFHTNFFEISINMFLK